jgi:hypothetical protein
MSRWREIANQSENVRLVYGSTDGGAHWANVAVVVPVDASEQPAVDPQDANTVYVATDAGVYFTTQIANCVNSNSSCWSAFGTGLPGAPVMQLSVPPAAASAQVLLAATYGRGVWQTPLWTASTN